MAPFKKKEVMKPTTLWGDIFREKDNKISVEENGEVYKVQPVDPYTFVSSPDYLGMNIYDPPLSEEQHEFLKNMSDFENGKTLGVLWVGKGGGKNTMSCVLFCYLVYKLLCMHSPHGYFKRSATKAITLMNVAINANQGRRNFFDPLKAMLRTAGPKAFTSFGFDPEKDILNSEIMFPKNIQLISANSASGGIEGYDILAALLDEVDDAEFHSIENLLTVLRSSSKSRFFGKEKVMAISYSRYEGSNGKIRKMYEDFKDVPYAYTRKVPSWVFNPNPLYTRESLDNEFSENEVKAKTIYECEPPDGFMDSWIKDSKRIKAAMLDSGGDWVLDIPLPSENYRKEPYSEYKWQDSLGNEFKINPFKLPIRRRGIRGMKYVLVCDPGLGSEANGGDAYGVTLAHREVILRENGVKYPRVVVDFAFRFTGAMFSQGQVQMSAVEDLVDSLVEDYGYDIRIFSSDPWNSALTGQNIAKKHKQIAVFTGSSSYVVTADYTLLRDLIFGEAISTEGDGRREFNGGIQLPYHPILFNELKELKEDRRYKQPKVDHPDDGSKDIADTVAKACTYLIKQWPYADLMVSVQGNRPKESLASIAKNNPLANHEFIKKLIENKTQKELKEKQEKMFEVNSMLFGVGSFKKGK